MKRTVMVAAVAGLVVLACGGAARAGNFADPTECNVLRQMDAAGTNLVVAGTGFQPVISGSASGSHFGQGASVEFTLPDMRTVGSYYLTFAGYGAHRSDSFTIEGWTGSSWVTLVTNSSPGGTNGGAFTSGAQTVSKIRLTTSGASATGYCVPNELCVYLDSSVTGSRGEGYNFLRDATVTAVSSPNVTGVWKTVENSPVGAMIDGNYADSPHLKVLDNGNGSSERAYLAFKLDQPEYMTGGTVGFYAGQGWNNFEVYTATTDLVASLNSIGTYPDKAAMLAAGKRHGSY